MKANVNKKPDFDKEFVESAIVLNRTMDDICKELKTTSYYVEKRIFVLYDEFEAGAKIDALYGGLREMMPALRERSANGESVDALAKETWDFFCSIQ